MGRCVQLERRRAELRDQDFTVFAPPNLLRGVATDGAYIASFLAQRTSGPVVLVGHSYGGLVITNAGAAGGDMRALVYVDAFIPDEGETVFQILGGSGSALVVAVLLEPLLEVRDRLLVTAEPVQRRAHLEQRVAARGELLRAAARLSACWDASARVRSRPPGAR